MRSGAALSAVWCGLLLGCGPMRASPSWGREARLTLLHTSDIHSRLWPFRARISSFAAEQGLGAVGTLSEVGGMARVATLLARERARTKLLWLDSGDALEGAAVFERYGGRVELELLGSLGLAAMALGNHELSLSAPALAELLASSASFPVLSANLRPSAESPLAGLLTPSAVLEVDGLRVGVVGVANPHSPPGVEQGPSNGWGLEPIAPLAAAVQLAVDDLAPRVGLVVVLSHLGLDEDHALVRATSGVGVVLGGHQHLLTSEPDWEDACSTDEVRATRACSPRRVPIVHSGAYAQWLTRLELRLVAEPGASLEVAEAKLEVLAVAAGVPQEPKTSAYLASRRPPPEPPIGFLASALPRRSPLAGDSGLGDVTADAVLLQSGADVVWLNSSGLREDLEAGVLLQSDLQLAFPFAEPWRRLRLSGSELRQALSSAARRSAERGCESTLQVAGLRLRVSCAACRAGQASCLEVERRSLLGSSPLRDDEQLLVVVPDYLTRAGGELQLLASRGELLELSVVDAIAELVARQPSFAASEPCSSALLAFSDGRCSEAFGELECPFDEGRARAVCANLPELEESRDGRIEMQP
jgi:5'-nucleotidase/UDP-sugar diphosphatase